MDMVFDVHKIEDLLGKHKAGWLVGGRVSASAAPAVRSFSSTVKIFTILIVSEKYIKKVMRHFI